MPGPVPGPHDAHAALERQLQAQQQIARLAQTLLSLPAEELDQGIREQLAIAAELAGVERTRLVVANPKTGRVAAAYDWWSESEHDVPPIEADFFQRFAWASEQIKRGDIVQMGADSLPHEASAERDRVRSQGVRSVLVIPVRFGKAIIGGHIFASRSRERIWSQQEIANLRVVTEILASAIRRRRAEHALREREQRFRAIAEHATELVSEFDSEARYHYASPSFARHLGHDPASLIGKPASTLVHPDDVEKATRDVARGVAEGVEVRVTHRMRHRDGTWRWFESSGGLYQTPNGSRRFVCIGRHVSERVAMEEAMSRQLRAEQEIAALSRRFLAVSAHELDGAIREALAEAGALADAERVLLYTLALSPEDRRGFVYEWCARGIESGPGMRCPWSETQLAQGRVLQFGSIEEIPDEAAAERANWRRQGTRSLLVIPVRLERELAGLIAFETRTRPRRWTDSEVALLGLVGEILSSASRRCQVDAALRESQARLLHAQKLEAVGRLAGGVAHDFNNLLSVILGFSRPLLRELPDGPVRDDVREIQAAAERGAGLTRQLLTFGRRQESPLQPVDLNAVLRGIAPLVARLLGDDVELALDLADGLAPVRGDAQQFEQIAINLAVNARDAMPDGGCFRFETREAQLTADRPSRHRLAPGRYVRLCASDTGVGMDEETRARIFEPFFTTKEPGKGTGLGLSIVYSVVEAAGGAIAVDAAPGKGTTFEMFLPEASPPPGRARSDA
ncbi:MAG TPA: ATP-binding protein [Myxococcota bacterium]|nr:ATP-binding protein [Myxococcota bacterium]